MLIPGHRGIKVRNSLKSPHYFVIFRKNATKPYSSLPSEAVFANSTGILVVAFGLLVLYILLASPWKRPDPGTLTDRQVWLLVPIVGGVRPGLGKDPGRFCTSLRRLTLFARWKAKPLEVGD